MHFCACANLADVIHRSFPRGTHFVHRWFRWAGVVKSSFINIIFVLVNYGQIFIRTHRTQEVCKQRGIPGKWIFWNFQSPNKTTLSSSRGKAFKSEWQKESESVSRPCFDCAQFNANRNASILVLINVHRLKLYSFIKGLPHMAERSGDEQRTRCLEMMRGLPDPYLGRQLTRGASLFI